VDGLLKQSRLDEKYRHPAMEGLASLFRIPWRDMDHTQGIGGSKNHLEGIKVVSGIEEQS
jgi:hypothetical protein